MDRMDVVYPHSISWNFTHFIYVKNTLIVKVNDSSTLQDNMTKTCQNLTSSDSVCNQR